ncbi:hypothetical protein [Roseivirga misakiensis]|uniref:Uncharacterized protein n=1 Tax=Roseivirga misakiensis TaxID=1563681 RepID=A0A1E5T0K6_9BACT|nr:hypothetical protein [Roseivirga misakiensis]OEK04910.1 hypothetical protein BFP71_15855 [Roseivirga misakiensis]
MRKDDIELGIPKWQLGILLLFSAILLLLGTVFQGLWSDFTLLFVITGLVLFIPAYLIIGADIAARPITHRWAVFMFTLPIIAPFVYFIFRERLKPVVAEVI